MADSWSVDEKSFLTNLIQQHGVKSKRDGPQSTKHPLDQPKLNPSTVDWSKIAQSFPSTSHRHSRVRKTLKLNDKSVRRGAWHPEEDERLRQYMRSIQEKGATISWVDAAVAIGTRTAEQASKRWKATLDPSISHQTFSAQEDALILKGVSIHGTAWADIISHCGLKHRSGLQVKNRWDYLARLIQAALKDRPLTRSGHHRKRPRSAISDVDSESDADNEDAPSPQPRRKTRSSAASSRQSSSSHGSDSECNDGPYLLQGNSSPAPKQMTAISTSNHPQSPLPLPLSVSCMSTFSDSTEPLVTLPQQPMACCCTTDSGVVDVSNLSPPYLTDSATRHTMQGLGMDLSNYGAVNQSSIIASIQAPSDSIPLNHNHQFTVDLSQPITKFGAAAVNSGGCDQWMSTDISSTQFNMFLEDLKMGMDWSSLEAELERFPQDEEPDSACLSSASSAISSGLSTACTTEPGSPVIPATPALGVNQELHQHLAQPPIQEQNNVISAPSPFLPSSYLDPALPQETSGEEIQEWIAGTSSSSSCQQRTPSLDISPSGNNPLSDEGSVIFAICKLSDASKTFASLRHILSHHNKNNHNQPMALLTSALDTAATKGTSEAIDSI